MKRFRGRDRASAASDAMLPAGERIYAIGDIHGRLDLLRTLFTVIERDIGKRPPARNRVVVLGDFIDRGPDSARVLSILAAQTGNANFVVLQGNHEAALLAGLAGERSALDLWLHHGGDATLRSFGATDDEIDPPDPRALPRIVRRTIPTAARKWLERLPLTHRAGRYLFVHAGIRPGVAIARQTTDDLLWIRDDFIVSDADHGVVVVHGHSVSETVCLRANRIGVDTGAYRTGRLSAVGLEGNARWVLDARTA